jgi:hypothetical protein
MYDHARQARSCIVELALEVSALADIVGDERSSQLAMALAENAGGPIGFSKTIIDLMRTSAAHDVTRLWGALAPSERGSYAKQVKRRLAVVPPDHARQRRQ